MAFFTGLPSCRSTYRFFPPCSCFASSPEMVKTQAVFEKAYNFAVVPCLGHHSHDKFGGRHVPVVFPAAFLKEVAMVSSLPVATILYTRL